MTDLLETDDNPVEFSFVSMFYIAFVGMTAGFSDFYLTPLMFNYFNVGYKTDFFDVKFFEKIIFLVWR